MAETVFSLLTDDVILNIFLKLEDDPRHWARLACVCNKFSSLIRNFCWKNKCSHNMPSLVSDLLSDSSSAPPGGWASLHKLAICCPGLLHAGVLLESSDFGLELELGPDENHQRKRKVCRSLTSHLACGNWNLSREQGNKLLARQFRDDCLYICDWPGCVHVEEKRNYMLFRGIFKNFKRSRVWRTINDGNRKKIDLNCAFCLCKETWDLHSAFCLRRIFGYHDDGEPVVRAYVCENGHVSGAWTDLPLFT
ncbi:Phytochrome A-associated F-box protein [Senna tora]|uniref:Phytochrome A-associated F-box protein n=1 Tax=Senna tora TaxID=362788 RepID=A0A834TC57_9FABA|nr:Phytochrome A-associated F-box protein [Senna tora]